MTQAFEDHDLDDHELYTHHIPLSECKSYMRTEEDGTQVKVTEVPILSCECLWSAYQQEAERIVAPNGTLLSPQARNRAINAAYARLWLHDNRFQWAGLAAFASKQVGCGLLHATADIRKFNGVSQPYQHVYDLLALGNTTLFLDIWPIHAFYAKRGLKELKECLGNRAKIFNRPKHPVLWPVGEKTLRFGLAFPQIVQAFEAIDAGRIAESVRLMAFHEQANILQPTIYNDEEMQTSLRLDQFAYVTGFLSGVSEAIELTLASQCSAVADGRTVGFGNDRFANLADPGQRMAFVLRAADRFDQMLHNANRHLLQQSIQYIANGGGVR